MKLLSYQELKDYLEALAKAHHGIKKFVGFSKQELHNELGKIRGEKFPMLCLFSYEGKLSGNEQRTFNARTIGFSVFKGGIAANDYTAQYAAISEAEQFGLEVLARINYDSKRFTSDHWLYQNFEKSTVRFEELRAFEAGGAYGMEFFFDIKVKQPFAVQAADWSDLTTVC